MKARHKDTGEIIQLAEEGVISSDGRHFCWYQVELLPEPIDEVHPSLPSNLDDAANKFAVSYDQGTCDGIAQECFKAGAEWMAEQGVTTECDVWESNNGLAYFLGTDDARELGILSCPEGTKVIVQIRKKEE